jgi:hypothetical protein
MRRAAQIHEELRAAGHLHQRVCVLQVSLHSCLFVFISIIMMVDLHSFPSHVDAGRQ